MRHYHQPLCIKIGEILGSFLSGAGLGLGKGRSCENHDPEIRVKESSMTRSKSIRAYSSNTRGEVRSYFGSTRQLIGSNTLKACNWTRHGTSQIGAKDDGTFFFVHGSVDLR